MSNTGYDRFENSGNQSQLGLSFYDDNGVREDQRVRGGVGLNESYTVAPSSKIGPLNVPRDGSIRNSPSGVKLVPSGFKGASPVNVGSRAISAPRVIQRRVVQGSPYRVGNTFV